VKSVLLLSSFGRCRTEPYPVVRRPGGGMTGPQRQDALSRPTMHCLSMSPPTCTLPLPGSSTPSLVSRL
jgi:hypothetical protein